MHKKVLLVIILVVLVAGCVGDSNGVPDFSNPFSTSGDFEPQEEEKVEGHEDVVSIKDVRLVPSSPVYPRGQEVVFTVVVENKDETKTAEEVYVDLFDPSLFEIISQDKCSKKNTCEILPQGEKVVHFSLKAPTKKETGNVRVDTNLEFRTIYQFKSNTKMDLMVANLEEITNMERTGKGMSPELSKTIGSGPIKIEPRLSGSESYALTKYSTSIEFQLSDKGSGGILENEIEPTELKITFPEEFPQVQAPGSPDAGSGITGYLSLDDVDDNESSDQAEVLSHGEEGCDEENKQCGDGLHCSYGRCCSEEPYEVQNNNGDCKEYTCRGENRVCTKTYGGCGTVGLHEAEGKCPNAETECCSVESEAPEVVYRPGTENVSSGVHFRCTENNVCENWEKMRFFEDRTPKMIFTAITPDIGNVPYKTYTLMAEMEYRYEVRDDYQVVVEEFDG